MAPIKIY